jgi:hypothetical protein
MKLLHTLLALVLPTIIAAVAMAQAPFLVEQENS